ncbi:UPF0175 family protein [Thermococcus sp. 2319x1]|uniref:UPF0175 family protein n=1 Tax=Thermococcus sp. 2319x1 TaxID=1674923 RepID=UPI00130E049D|nr:UPF0175 family protein [Thermococcus sp. 2319x1]
MIIVSEVFVSVPQDLARILRISEKDPQELRGFTLLLNFTVRGIVSLGKAAEIAGVSRWEMIEILASKGVSLQYDEEDSKEDIKTLERSL